MNEGREWLDFIQGLNTVICKTEEEFNLFRECLNKLELIDLLHGNLFWDNWVKLAKINNHDYGYIIFELTPEKGFTYGWKKDESIHWYGRKPLTVKQFKNSMPKTLQ